MCIYKYVYVCILYHFWTSGLWYLLKSFVVVYTDPYTPPAGSITHRPNSQFSKDISTSQPEYNYGDVIMSAVVSQITGVSIVCSIVCSGTNQRNHQRSASLAFVRGIHRWPVDFPHKGPVTRKMFPFDDVIMPRILRPQNQKIRVENGRCLIYNYIFTLSATVMMTSSNGNIFRVTGPLCGEFIGPGEFPTQRPVTRSFDVFFDLRLNKRLSKQPWGWWFETPLWSLWRHCNVVTTYNVKVEPMNEI